MRTQLFISGSWMDGESVAAVADKFTGRVLGEVAQAGAAQVQQAVAALAAGQRRDVPPPYERYEILTRAARLVTERRAALADTMVSESGFTLDDVAGEIDRTAQTLRLCGEEATRIAGEMVPLDGAPGVRDRLGFTIRRPVGVVCAITPFNSPLNTPAHKVGPAIAAGNAVVLKPATYTPLSAAALVEILLDAGLPPSLIALLHGSGASVGAPLLADPRVGFYTFTGSTEVGHRIRAGAGVRPTQLELGGLSSTIVCADADPQAVVDRCMPAAFRKAGQVCTSVQRLYLHEDIRAEVTDRLVSAVERQRYGDPHQPGTLTGPLISGKDADRVMSWVDEALAAGASALAGGRRDGRVVAPTVLAGVSASSRVMCQEVFGPVVSLRSFTDLDRAVDEVNDTPYGLSAGIFTNDLRAGIRAAERLRMGSVHINQTSSSRVDLMPYGGVKESGFGREGPRYAIQEMTEERLVTVDYG
ncbi:MAG: aldehyde dehydrogenase family protein [Micromonosporaceae bacterium]|nr:aldehyde dehydrogenase family protein [Micromonosporaceae bacterium]